MNYLINYKRELMNWNIYFTGLFDKTKQTTQETTKENIYNFLPFSQTKGGFWLVDVFRKSWGFPTWSWSCMSACWWFQRLQLHAFEPDGGNSLRKVEIYGGRIIRVAGG